MTTLHEHLRACLRCGLSLPCAVRVTVRVMWRQARLQEPLDGLQAENAVRIGGGAPI